MGRYKVLWFDQALEDLRMIATYLAGRRGLHTALNFVEQIEASTDALLTFPEIGALRTFNGESGRILVPRQFKHYIIFYRFEPSRSEVRVIRILKGLDLSALQSSS